MSPSMTDYSSMQHYTDSYTFEGQTQQPNYNTEANMALILDEADKLFNKLVKDNINKVITDCTFSKSPLPSLTLLSASEEEQ